MRRSSARLPPATSRAAFRPLFRGYPKAPMDLEYLETLAGKGYLLACAGGHVGEGDRGGMT